MSRQEIKASDGYTILGYIETMPNGDQQAFAKDGYTKLGYYNAQRNATLDKDGYTTLATGNALSGRHLPKALAQRHFREMVHRASVDIRRPFAGQVCQGLCFKFRYRHDYNGAQSPTAHRHLIS